MWGLIRSGNLVVIDQGDNERFFWTAFATEPASFVQRTTHSLHAEIYDSRTYETCTCKHTGIKLDPNMYLNRNVVHPEVNTNKLCIVSCHLLGNPTR